MKELFEEAERQLGATVSFANDAQRDRFITLLGDGVRASVTFHLKDALRDALPQIVADQIAATVNTKVQERLAGMEAKLNEIEAETEKGSDGMNDVLKEHRAKQQDWRGK